MKNKYGLIYADPPWDFDDKKTGGSMKSGAEQVYKNVMTIADIMALPVPEIAADNCVLVMWWVGPMPQEAIDTVKAWGFKLKNMNGFVWEKLTRANGKLFFGMGHWTRGGAESAIIAVKGKPKRINASVRSVIRARVGEHSAKPEEARKRCVKLVGKDIPRIELFGRGETKKGWHVFGNEYYGDNKVILENGEFTLEVDKNGN
ncbi:MT-A70 family methyltransferase [Vibrio fluvialis]|uniref:MT-A70 family methyltransferase n=1 Tax=Vibrio fluvialis TaxID=676 RepID=UPI001F392019|nr:MT-A70 family methyltransferase [Vibrio fluvialis]MCE7580971.1 MT-A70 family methyltransferase [Vibrio fluvialis]MCG6405337.1 MT-A70 family methyltransferase [Vibrio fluvialis]